MFVEMKNESKPQLVTLKQSNNNKQRREFLETDTKCNKERCATQL